MKYRSRWRGNEWHFKYYVEGKYKWWPFWFHLHYCETFRDAQAFVSQHKNRIQSLGE